MKCKLSETIIGKIKKEKICPKSKCLFILKHLFFWLLFILSTIFGGIVFGVFMFVFLDADISILKDMSDFFIGILLVLLPLLWLLILGGLIIIAIYGAKHTKKGYKFPPFHIGLLSFIISIVLGGLIFIYGGGEAIEETMENNLSSYKSVKDKIREKVFNPENGHLAGTIIMIDKNKKYFIIKDVSPKHIEWKIYINNETKMIPPPKPEDFIQKMPFSENKKKKLIEHKIEFITKKYNLKKEDLLFINFNDSDQQRFLFITMSVRIKGQKISDNEFQAKEISPFGDRAKHKIEKLKNFLER